MVAWWRWHDGMHGGVAEPPDVRTLHVMYVKQNLLAFQRSTEQLSPPDTPDLASCLVIAVRALTVEPTRNHAGEGSAREGPHRASDDRPEADDGRCA